GRPGRLVSLLGIAFGLSAEWPRHPSPSRSTAPRAFSLESDASSVVLLGGNRPITPTGETCEEPAHPRFGSRFFRGTRRIRLPVLRVARDRRRPVWCARR